MYQWAESLVVRLHSGGVLLTSGTDFSNPRITPWPTLHVELERLQDAGIAPLDVLRIATSNGARALGVADALGGIAPGYLADLIVVDADPSEDVRNLRRIATVITAGRQFSPGELLREWPSGHRAP
jgi:imidazolonepropionase-like amidohydrolase